MKFVSNLFFTDIDFCKPKVLQGLDLNFSFYSLNILRGAKVSSNLLILFKYIAVELSLFSSSIFNKSSQSTEKESRIKFPQSNMEQSLS